MHPQAKPCTPTVHTQAISRRTCQEEAAHKQPLGAQAGRRKDTVNSDDVSAARTELGWAGWLTRWGGRWRPRPAVPIRVAAARERAIPVQHASIRSPAGPSWTRSRRPRRGEDSHWAGRRSFVSLLRKEEDGIVYKSGLLSSQAADEATKHFRKAKDVTAYGPSPRSHREGACFSTTVDVITRSWRFKEF